MRRNENKEKRDRRKKQKSYFLCVHILLIFFLLFVPFKVIICHFSFLCLLLQHFSLALEWNELCLYLVEQIERSTSLSPLFIIKNFVYSGAINWVLFGNLCLCWCAICQQDAVCFTICIMIYRISKSPKCN